MNGGVLQVFLGKLWKDMSNTHLMPVRSRYRGLQLPRDDSYRYRYSGQGVVPRLIVLPSPVQLLPGVAFRHGLVPACQAGERQGGGEYLGRVAGVSCSYQGKVRTVSWCTRIQSILPIPTWKTPQGG